MSIECIKRLRHELKDDNMSKQFKYSKFSGEPFHSVPLNCVVSCSCEPVDLWHGLLYQGEIACLFGQPNVGKTLLAMQIANHLHKRGLKTIYFDFENAAHQMKTRYNIDFNSSEGMFTIKEFNNHYSTAPHDAASILKYIKAEIMTEQAHVVIIDDINNILGSGSQQSVRQLLNTLRSWAKMFLVTILVIAHSDKCRPSQLTTLDSLTGSFELTYFFDSIFSLTRANKYNASHNNITHYIKQHKNRVGQLVYDDMNVITASLERDDQSGMLQFTNLYSGGNERQLLRDFGFRSDDDITQAILYYKSCFFTTREIAEIVGTSQSHVSRTLRAHHNKPATNPDPQPETENPQLETENPQLETENPQPETQNSQPITQNSQPITQNPQLTPTPKIKLELETTPLFIAPPYGYDFYGEPIYEKPDDYDDYDDDNSNDHNNDDNSYPQAT